MRNRWWVASGFAAAMLTVAACGSSSSGGSPSSSHTPTGTHSAASNAVKTRTIGGATVLTNAKGFTLYWFAPDTPTKSNCNGSCVTYWPPVKGPVAANGVSGNFSTITRSDGTTQATYNGHPLYTYVGDTAPGQAKGNGLNLSGGVWHEVVVSGSAPAPSASSSSSGGGGYGY
jgi:predicted lipoprotein with Yx(FWY)xxD motif